MTDEPALTSDLGTPTHRRASVGQGRWYILVRLIGIGAIVGAALTALPGALAILLLARSLLWPIDDPQSQRMGLGVGIILLPAAVTSVALAVLARASLQIAKNDTPRLSRRRRTVALAAAVMALVAVPLLAALGAVDPFFVIGVLPVVVFGAAAFVTAQAPTIEGAAQATFVAIVAAVGTMANVYLGMVSGEIL